MRRREFIAMIGGAAMLPLAARAQQPAMPVIGRTARRAAVTPAPRVALDAGDGVKPDVNAIG